MKLLTFILLISSLQALSSVHEQDIPYYRNINLLYNERQPSSPPLLSILVGYVLAIPLFVFFFICLWFSEKKIAIDQAIIPRAIELCETVDISNRQPTLKQGALVLARGVIHTNQLTIEPLAGITLPNLVKITREVEVLEWRVHRTRQYVFGRQVNHSHLELDWVSFNCPEVESQRATGYNDPRNWFISAQVVYNPEVYLGAYHLDQKVAELYNNQQVFTPTFEHANRVLRNTGRTDRIPSVNGNYIYLRPAIGQGYLNSAGTVRIRYVLSPVGAISVCASASGFTFTPFQIAEHVDLADSTQAQRYGVPDCWLCDFCDCMGRMCKPVQNILLVDASICQKNYLLRPLLEKSQGNETIGRIFLFVAFFSVIWMFLWPITVTLGHIPLVGGFIDQLFVAALLLVVPTLLILISLPWLKYGTKKGVILLIFGGGLLALFVMISNSKGGGLPKNSNFVSLRTAHV